MRMGIFDKTLDKELIESNCDNIAIGPCMDMLHQMLDILKL